ncbi:hypothetical protein GOP47_0024002 [Adiantum capillus-veneris]|uniref:Uncharacterized protein n=1 Tax=Adiantum capillus-veneris TaxID=13818 RepID=A0A9D4U5P9_ADICA|nr:hypothetical protein GOP47_0024002 [Adiantum capillus-veneris]
MGLSSSVRIVYSNLQILGARTTGLALARVAPSRASRALKLEGHAGVLVQEAMEGEKDAITTATGASEMESFILAF